MAGVALPVAKRKPMHWLLGKLVDHRVRVLVADGRLRQRGIFFLDKVRDVLYETKGSTSVVAKDSPRDPEPALLQAALRDAAGYP